MDETSASVGYNMTSNISYNVTTEKTNGSGEFYDECFAIANEAKSFQFYAWGVVANICSLYGIIGNILAIIVLRHRQMRNSTSYYLISLAIYDIGVLLSMSLFLAIPTFYVHKGFWEDYYFAYQYMHPYCYPLALVAQTGTIYTTVGFTVERYIAVCHPLQAANKCTKSRTKRVILLVFICSFVYNIPRFLETKTIEIWDEELNKIVPKIVQTEIGENKEFQQVYFIYLNLFIMFIFPFSLISVLNVHLIRAVNMAKKARTRMSTSASKEANLTIMLIAVIIVFLVCQLPSIADNILWTIFEMPTLHCSLSYIQFTSISNLMVIVNSAINFILYCMFGKRFRRVFIKIVYYPWKRKESQFKYGNYESTGSSRRGNSMKVYNSESTFL